MKSVNVYVGESVAGSASDKTTIGGKKCERCEACSSI